MKTVFHIRQQPPRKGGNQWYRDKRVFESTTLCGAECGLYDQLASHVRSKVFQRWLTTSECHIALCPECAAIANVTN